jgi:5-methylcytosine-specific restriction enzyme A
MAKDFRGQITREDIEATIAALDQGEPHGFGPSIYCDLLVGGRRYPPKAVVGLSARRLLGRALRPDEFSGGEESWAFRLLRDRGFDVVAKQRNDHPAVLPKVPPARTNCRRKASSSARRLASTLGYPFIFSEKTR